MVRKPTFERAASHALSILFLCFTLTRAAAAQQPAPVAALDSDHDGLSDAVEQSLLTQFAPRFMIARHDCAGVPAEFVPDVIKPTVKAEDGTIYGQVFPAKSVDGNLPAAEIHFYHLWGIDCGPHGHNLDTEHVAVLVTASAKDVSSAQWKAVYWYAAAHENTVCDVSQITRASTLHAEQSGATVFVSPGKHASFLNEKLCQGGCGADKCVDMVALPRGRIVNLGEAAHPMNGSVFTASAEWPLLNKMTSSNFPAAPLARLNQMPDSDIAWFNPGRHPAQGIISSGNVAGEAIAGGARDTAGSLNKADASTSVALSLTQQKTGNALERSFKATRHALGTSAKDVGAALSPDSKK